MKRTSTERRIIKNIRASYIRVSGRLKTLAKHSDEVVSPAYEVFKRSKLYDSDTNSIRKLSVRNKDLKELKELRDELYYIDSLKTSRLANAIEFTKTNASLMASIDKLPEYMQDRFWAIYKKFTEMNKGAYEIVKYEALGEIYATIGGRLSDDEILKNINFLYGKWVEEDDIFTNTSSHIEYSIPTNK